jgi:hypothetical protein
MKFLSNHKIMKNNDRQNENMLGKMNIQLGQLL